MTPSAAFDIPSPSFRVPLYPELKPLFRFKEIVQPSEWAEDKFKLGRGYGETGAVSFTGREWQRGILDSFMEYKTIIVCAPVLVGQSVCGIDIPWAWWQDNVGGRSLVIYADKDTAEGIFEEKWRDNIKNNLPHLWSGNGDDLRQDKIILLNGYTRRASANVENDIASFPADLVLLDEVAKYKGSHDIVGMARGRQKSYYGLPGPHGLMAIVSSPKRHGDPLYNEIHKGGVLILRWLVPCPHCGKYHELTDENIKELPNLGGEFDHDPVRIRQEQAAQYECPECKGVIADGDRWKMLAAGQWAAKGEEIGIDGRVINPIPLRKKSDTVCFWFNRLVSMPDKWTFADCLSAFFAARQSPDPTAWETYQNEDMARFINPRAQQVSHSFLLAKVKPYDQYGPAARIPKEVICLTCGIDTQDNGFYFVIVGWGYGMESWRIRQDFIKCDMKESIYHDPVKVLQVFKNGMFYPGFTREDGVEMFPLAGFIDEGGHRQKDAHFICKHIPLIKPYKGSNSPTAEPIRKSQSGVHYMGNTRHWSELVGRYMESDTWHLPKDISKQYLDQVVKQYWSEETDRRGKVKKKWVSGGDDHYRDCENLAIAAAFQLSLPEKLNDHNRVERMAPVIAARAAHDKDTVNQTTGEIVPPRGPAEKRVTPLDYRDRQRQAGRRYY